MCVHPEEGTNIFHIDTGTFHLCWARNAKGQKIFVHIDLGHGSKPVVKNLNFDSLVCCLNYSHSGTHCI